ncbi:hypothetical protein [Allomuricauda sp. SCSIO 65647]|uniref:hypothetical protein n=1 Tax=Allomuricauda sp. SCSIO 65647 TaxID=2908843 RepID=UPI001F17A793|nr:hypothetical protein [Muricauda sp. SCSIO 65647]UJH67719.1 hypothetical protein L0P89_00525 [Muricauda sp. SCSIO 65647]
MRELETFIEKVENFDQLSSSTQIDFFAYFLLIEQKNDGFIAKEISDCFDALHLPPYSNVPSYLSSKAKGKNKKFIKKNSSRYYIERKFKQKLDEHIGIPTLPSNVHSDFFPIELFDNTRGYLKTIANQALASYNKGIYDGCSVLTRKLIEILIIECFERHGSDNLIKNSHGNFYYLSDLITEFLKEPSWNIGRNAKRSLPKIKNIGDKSAHNRRYIARKKDLEYIKENVRTVIEELIHLIDYENWKK